MFVWKASVILEQFAKLLPISLCGSARSGDSMGDGTGKEVIRGDLSQYTQDFQA